MNLPHSARDDASLDAIGLIQRDHDQITALFAELSETTDIDQHERERLFSQLAALLTAHEFMEEEVLYPAMEQDEDGKDLIRENLQEHRQADRLLAGLKALDVGSAEWAPTSRLLDEAVRHHIQHEQDEMFPAARSMFSRDELREFGREMYEKRQKKLQSASDTNREEANTTTPSRSGPGPASGARTRRPGEKRKRLHK
jgi:hemerythrin superfamily protein